MILEVKYCYPVVNISAVVRSKDLLFLLKPMEMVGHIFCKSNNLFMMKMHCKTYNPDQRQKCLGN